VEKKSREGKAICKDISTLILSWNVASTKIFVKDFLMDEVVVNFYMLGMSMVNEIGR
jgi:hypothetical protein